jgi:hypothetical protein
MEIGWKTSTYVLISAKKGIMLEWPRCLLFSQMSICIIKFLSFISFCIFHALNKRLPERLPAEPKSP